MELPVINTREDIDAMLGTDGHKAFMDLLQGTLWNLEKDDVAGAWKAVEDNSTIERFGFTRADFPNAVPPSLPAYAPISGDQERMKRNALIAACDWTQLPDAPLTTAQKTAWSTYRQALRDISKQALFPVTIDWPVAP